jgi:predicted ATP-dependent endonuclease of OLD family
MVGKNMRLTQVESSDFRSIRKSNIFSVGDITCLVGKNEAGKSALLHALYRLNPIIAVDGKYDVTDDYPRSDVEEYRQAVEAGERKPAIVTEATYTLESVRKPDCAVLRG